MSGCANTQVAKVKETTVTELAKPDRILIQPFAVNTRDIDTGSSPLSMVTGSSSGKDQAATLAKEVNGALIDELSQKIKEMGFTPVVAAEGKQPGNGEIMVTGRWVKINEGNVMRRNVIGFGAGQSSADSEVAVIAPGSRKLISFSAHADSGSKPGAAVLGPAGAAAGAGTAATVGVNVARGAASTYLSASAHQASEIADKIADELSSYFAKQGWSKASR